MDLSIAILEFFAVFIIITIILSVIQTIALWKVFKKAGKPGWACLVPFYSNYILYEIVWGNGLLFLLLLIPVGNIVVSIVTTYKLAKAFGYGAGFGIGLIFLRFIFICILGFGKAEYVGPSESGKKGTIIAAIVVAVLYFILVIILSFGVVLLSFSMANNNINTETSDTYLDDYISEETSTFAINETEYNSNEEVSDITSDNTWKSDYWGLMFTTPSNYTLEDLSDSTNSYVMASSNTTANCVIMDTENYEGSTADDFTAQLETELLSQSANGYSYKSLGITDVQFHGKSCKKLSVKLDETSPITLYQDIYVFVNNDNLLGNRVLNITLTYTEDSDKVLLENSFVEYYPY